MCTWVTWGCQHHWCMDHTLRCKVKEHEGTILPSWVKGEDVIESITEGYYVHWTSKDRWVCWAYGEESTGGWTVQVEEITERQGHEQYFCRMVSSSCIRKTSEEKLKI